MWQSQLVVLRDLLCALRRCSNACFVGALAMLFVRLCTRCLRVEVLKRVIFTVGLPSPRYSWNKANSHCGAFTLCFLCKAPYCNYYDAHNTWLGWILPWADLSPTHWRYLLFMQLSLLSVPTAKWKPTVLTRLPSPFPGEVLKDLMTTLSWRWRRV